MIDMCYFAVTHRHIEVLDKSFVGGGRGWSNGSQLTSFPPPPPPPPPPPRSTANSGSPTQVEEKSGQFLGSVLVSKGDKFMVSIACKKKVKKKGMDLVMMAL